MTGDYPLGADNDTDAIRALGIRFTAADLRELRSELDAITEAERAAYRASFGIVLDDFPATPAGIVAGSDSSGLPATPKPHH